MLLRNYHVKKYWNKIKYWNINWYTGHLETPQGEPLWNSLYSASTTPRFYFMNCNFRHIYQQKSQIKIGLT